MAALAQSGPVLVMTRKEAPVVLMRRLLGEVLRRRRTDQGRTLREVAASARVSLGYLSEVERGRKEASSELLAAICGALGVPMSVVMREVSDELARAETAAVVTMGVPDVGRLPRPGVPVGAGARH
jgi:transcriptional regulator with XRE-family HTH domain